MKRNYRVRVGDLIRVHDTSGFKYPERLLGATFKVKSVQGDGISGDSILHVDVYSPIPPGSKVDYGIRRDRAHVVKGISEEHTMKGITKQSKPYPWEKVQPTFLGKWFVQAVLTSGITVPVNTEINIEYSGKRNPRYKFNMAGDVYLVTWDWMKEARDTNKLTREPVDYALIEKAAAEQAERVAKNLGEWVTNEGEIREITASGSPRFPYRYTTEYGHNIDYSEVCFCGFIEAGHYKRPYSEHGPVPVDHVDHMVTLTKSGDTSELVLGVVYVTRDVGCNHEFHIVRIGPDKHLLYVSRSQGWLDYGATNTGRGRNLSPVYEWPIIPQELVESSGLAAVWAAVPDEVNEAKV